MHYKSTTRALQPIEHNTSIGCPVVQECFLLIEPLPDRSNPSSNKHCSDQYCTHHAITTLIVVHITIVTSRIDVATSTNHTYLYLSISVCLITKSQTHSLSLIVLSPPLLSTSQSPLSTCLYRYLSAQ
jgi:hypothetical protein